MTTVQWTLQHIKDVAGNNKYCLTSNPVVITGFMDKRTTAPWTMQHIKDVSGNSVLTQENRL